MEKGNVYGVVVFLLAGRQVFSKIQLQNMSLKLTKTCSFQHALYIRADETHRVFCSIKYSQEILQ